MDLELVRHLIEDVIDEWFCYREIDLVEISMLEMALNELNIVIKESKMLSFLHTFNIAIPN